MSGAVHVILNPTAGGGAAGRLRSRIERQLGANRMEFTLDETADRGHAVELARSAARNGASAVVAVGGDGTIHEVANGLLLARDSGEVTTAPALGVLPAGTGNDFVKLIQGADQFDVACAIVAAGYTRNFDVGRVSWGGDDGIEPEEEYFINGMGTGVDVEVVRQIARLPRFRGATGYLIGLVRALINFRAIPLRFRLDGRASERKVMIMAVGNGPCQAGSFYLCPDALPEDGRFDICMVDEIGYIQIVRVIARVLRGRHTGMPSVNMEQASNIEIEAGGDQPLFFQLDGELREPADLRRFRVELLRGALPVLAPKAAS